MLQPVEFLHHKGILLNFCTVKLQTVVHEVLKALEFLVKEARLRDEQLSDKLVVDVCFHAVVSALSKKVRRELKGFLR